VSTTPLDHEQVIALLPDYALGALEPAELDLVAEHLESCPACRAELFSILELGALISDLTSPAPALRRRLLAAASGETVPALSATIAPARDQPAPIPIGRPRQTRGIDRRRQAQVLLAAAAAVLIIGLGIWNLRLRDGNQHAETIAGIVSSAAVYPLTESQVMPPAKGVLLVGADDRQALLIADNLPPLAAGEEYQIWLFDASGQSAPAGVLTADAAGTIQTVLTPPQPVSSYVAIAVSAEPAGGSTQQSGPLALGGWLGAP
jgi:anti-sigma factor RsiW